MQKDHILYLIPTPIGKRKENLVLPDHTIEIIKSLDCFIVEKPQTSISFLKWIGHPKPEFEITFRVLNKKTPGHEVYSYLSLLKSGNVGLMSEAGAPGVADPGSGFISLVHDNGYRVVPLTGPSSILLALMASGLNGQQFSFYGYLSLRDNERLAEIKFMEEFSLRSGQTQIFMETPHRNQILFQTLLQQLSPSTKLCIASNITQPDEFIKTKRVSEWKQTDEPDLQKKPALFLFNSK
ncbi:MAG: SAM-dependent methyltransferase [Balneolaceae bacterium]